MFSNCCCMIKKDGKQTRERIKLTLLHYHGTYFGSMIRRETSSIIENFNAKIAIVHFSIDINRESEAEKVSVKRIKMRKTSPPVRWTHEKNERSY